MGNIVLQTTSRNVNGEERLTTNRVNYSTIGSDLICARIAQTANIKVTTVKSALLGIKEAVRYFVLNGHSVNLGPFGIIGVAISADTVAKASQVNRNLIRGINYSYRPSTEIKSHLANIKFS